VTITTEPAAGSSAIDGTDYVSGSTTLTFNKGQACVSGTPMLPLTEDETANEANETVQVTLSNPSKGWTLGTPETAAFTIQEEGTPMAPLSNVGASASGTTITLSWTDSNIDAVDHYHILRSTTQGSGFTEIATVPGSTTNPFFSYADPNLASNTTYYYEIYAESDGLTGPIATTSATTG
jgi:hypothetical protein